VVDGYVPHDLPATGGSEGSGGAEAVAAPPITARALLCHAEADPFVPRDGVDACLAALGERGCRWELQAFGAAGGARQRSSWLETHYRSHTDRPPRGEPSLAMTLGLSWLHRSHLGKDGRGAAISAISAIYMALHGCVV